MSIFKKYICGCSLTKGAIILGWLGIIGFIPSIISVVYILTNHESSTDDIEKFAKENPDRANDIALLRKIVLPHFIYILLLLLNIFSLAGSVFLILGAKRRNNKFITFFLVIDGLGILSFLAFILYIFHAVCVTGSTLGIVFLVTYLVLFGKVDIILVFSYVV